jgi:hypothetical protein
MSNYTTPTFETSDFVDSDVICTSQHEDESIYETSIFVRWKLNITFDKAGIWSITPEITWIQTVVNFQNDEIEADPQKQREGSAQHINFTPETKGWTVVVDVQKEGNNTYRCISAYIDVDDQTATIIFE